MTDDIKYDMRSAEALGWAAWYGIIQDYTVMVPVLVVDQKGIEPKILRHSNEISLKLRSELCEYNPTEKRGAYANEAHARADLIVGFNGKWRLCTSCAALPEFARYKKRKAIIRQE